MSNRCWFWHAWGKWIVIAENNIVRKDTTDNIGFSIRQERTCNRCGFKELSQQTKYI